MAVHHILLCFHSHTLSVGDGHLMAKATYYRSPMESTVGKSISNQHVVYANESIPRTRYNTVHDTVALGVVHNISQLCVGTGCRGDSL